VDLSEELASDLGRVRRKVVFHEKSCDEKKHEKMLQSDSDEEGISDESESEIESASNSDIDSNSGSDSSAEDEVKRKSEILNIEHTDTSSVSEDSSKDKINLSGKNKSKKQKPKGTVAVAEYKLLKMMDEDVDEFGNEDECKEQSDEDDGKLSDEVPTKKQKLIDEEVKENKSHR